MGFPLIASAETNKRTYFRINAKIVNGEISALIMAIAMVAMLAFGGTYAFFSATAANATGNITTGLISLKNNGTTTLTFDSNMLPGESDDISVRYTEGSNRGSWIFFEISHTVTPKSGTISDGELTVALSALKVNDAPAQSFESAGKTIYYFEIIDDNAGKDGYKDLTVTSTVTLGGTATNPDGAGHPAMEATIAVTLTAKSVQHSAGTTAADAYAQFGL